LDLQIWTPLAQLVLNLLQQRIKSVTPNRDPMHEDRHHDRLLRMPYQAKKAIDDLGQTSRCETLHDSMVFLLDTPYVRRSPALRRTNNPWHQGIGDLAARRGWPPVPALGLSGRRSTQEQRVSVYLPFSWALPLSRTADRTSR
jgi:hypothetical protein